MPTTKTLDGASLEVLFTDGTTGAVNIPAFRRTPSTGMTDPDIRTLIACMTLDRGGCWRERIVATAMAARSRYAHLPRNFR
jgi:hypothetical protein